MAIPKKIHYCWFGHSQIPEQFQQYIESWKKLCPDYEIKQWNESNYDVTKNRYMREAYEQKKWGFVPDYARLDIIYNEGGIYLDTDIEIIKSFDELLTNSAFCGIEAGSNTVAFGLGFGAEKGNAIIKLLRDCYDDMVFVQEDGTLNLLPSPEINTKPLLPLGYHPSDRIQQLHYDGSSITVYPEQYFCPKDYESGNMKLNDVSFSIHHYAATWKTAAEKQQHDKRQKAIARYGKEKVQRMEARRNSVLRAVYYLKHPVLAIRKIKEKLR